MLKNALLTSCLSSIVYRLSSIGPKVRSFVYIKDEQSS